MAKILIKGFGIKYEESTFVRYAMKAAKAVVGPRTSLPITRRRALQLEHCELEIIST